MTMIRGEKYKLVHFLGEDYGQLFDLEADPGEINNLWDDAGLEGVKQSLLQSMLDWRIESGLETRNLFQDHR